MAETEEGEKEGREKVGEGEKGKEGRAPEKSPGSWVLGRAHH